MTINYLTAGIAIVLVLVLLALAFKTGKNKKYKVVVGDREYEVSRGWSESLKDRKDFTCFKQSNGKLVWLSNRFTIVTEEK